VAVVVAQGRALQKGNLAVWELLVVEVLMPMLGRVDLVVPRLDLVLVIQVELVKRV
jgi:hypothetical protein